MISRNTLSGNFVYYAQTAKGSMEFAFFACSSTEYPRHRQTPKARSWQSSGFLQVGVHKGTLQGDVIK